MYTNLKEKPSNVVDTTSTAAHTVAKESKGVSQNLNNDAKVTAEKVSDVTKDASQNMYNDAKVVAGKVSDDTKAASQNWNKDAKCPAKVQMTQRPPPRIGIRMQRCHPQK